MPPLSARLGFGQSGSLSERLGYGATAPLAERLMQTKTSTPSTLRVVETKFVPTPGQEETTKIDRKSFADKITRAENEINMEGDLYGSIGVTGDLGKYQVKPDTLKDWSKHWLGKTYTKKQFLADPKAQETFFEEYMNVADAYGLTPEEAALAWHMGFGAVGENPKDTRKERLMQNIERFKESAEGKKYLAERFSATD